MYILGLNAYHGDSAACLYKNDQLVAASEEERFRRIKHWAGLPTEAIKFCLKEEGIDLTQVDYITVSRDPKAKLGQKALHVLKGNVSFSALGNRMKNSFNIKELKNTIAVAFGYEEKDLKVSVKYIEHHRCHIASAFHISPYEEAAILSVDGMGDFTSTMRGIGKGSKIKIIDSVSYPHSVGYFYTAFTQYLGFYNYGDEYKVMGLSPYGQVKKELVDLLKKEVLIFKKGGKFELNSKFFRHFKEGISMSWNNGAPAVEALFSDQMVKKFGTTRKKEEALTQFHKDLAASVQKVTEDVIFYMAEDLYKKTGLKNICLTGGCAQNSVANGKLIENTSFEQLFVPPAGYDAGTATGSALYFYHHELGNARPSFKIAPYTGIKYSNIEIEKYLKKKEISYKKYDETTLCEVVSEKLLNGGVIGWYQGRAEFGPRALGNRSIIVDPRRADAKELLNLKIKRRESFRPFAPSILKEATAEYFEQVDDVPFMEKVFKIKKEKWTTIPAVTHVDGTGRLQTVEEKTNPLYYRLIKRFGEKSGVPVLLNTSFNENEPIVNTPEHALDCFLRTKMDMLVMGNVVVERN